jgi:hypothetical protein
MSSMQPNLAKLFFGRSPIWLLPQQNPQKSGKYSTSTLSLVINRVRFFLNLQKKYSSPDSENHQFWWISEFHLVFLFSLASPLDATYIFTPPTCTATIIPLEPCAWNAEFHHFILNFNKISLLCGYHWKETPRQGEFMDFSYDIRKETPLFVIVSNVPMLAWKHFVIWCSRSGMLHLFLLHWYLHVNTCCIVVFPLGTV